MMNRDFSISVLERLYAICGLLDNSLLVASECDYLQERPPEDQCKAVGLVLGTINGLLEPIWKEHPDLAHRYFGESIFHEQKGSWSRFEPKSLILTPSPMNAFPLQETTALRLLVLYEACHFQLNFVLESAQKHGVNAQEKLFSAIEIIVNSINQNLVEPILLAFPKFASASYSISSRGWAIPLRPNPSIKRDG